MQIFLFELPLWSGDVPHVLNVPNVPYVIHVQHDIHMIWYLILYVLYIEYICVSSHNFQFHVIFIWTNFIFVWNAHFDPVMFISYHQRDLLLMEHRIARPLFIYMNHKFRTKLQWLFLFVNVNMKRKFHTKLQGLFLTWII